MVSDSSWEATESFVLDRHDSVRAWVKNDYLGLQFGITTTVRRAATIPIL